MKNILSFASIQPQTRFVPLTSIRIKVTDRCAWNCWWCHNEGTGKRNPNIVGDIYWTAEFVEVLLKLKNFLGINEVHLTGGEPTLHPHLPHLISSISQLGFSVKATSIGCSSIILQSLIESGLSGINFSFHATDDKLLHNTQIDRTYEWTSIQFKQQIESILLAQKLGANVKINTVMAQESDIPRVSLVLAWALEHNIPIRILPELSNIQQSLFAIMQLCDQLEAVEIDREYTLGSSNTKAVFKLPNHQTFELKFIRNLVLKTMCSHCSLRDNLCFEKFYGLRLEKQLVNGQWGLFFRLCIHRTGVDTYFPVTTFFNSPQFVEIHKLLNPPDDRFPN